MDLLRSPTAIPPVLGPLANSHDADQVESDLKAAFLEVFEAMVRPRLVSLNTYGMAHRSDFATVERFVKADGLALDRQSSREAFMRELHRSWRARNPRRGMGFLKHYMQLLYPGSSTVQQMWQDPGLTYPTGASTVEIAGRFLTSRVRVSLVGSTAYSAADILRLQSIFSAITPARLVIEMFASLGGGFTMGTRMAGALTVMTSTTFTGTAAP